MSWLLLAVWVLLSVPIATLLGTSFQVADDRRPGLAGTEPAAEPAPEMTEELAGAGVGAATG